MTGSPARRRRGRGRGAPGRAIMRSVPRGAEADISWREKGCHRKDAKRDKLRGGMAVAFSRRRLADVNELAGRVGHLDGRCAKGFVDLRANPVLHLPDVREI